MAEYSGIGTGFRIIILLLLLSILVLGGLIWFDYLGLIDARQSLALVYRLFGAEEGEVDVEDPFLLERERLNKQLDALALRAEDLETNSLDLTYKEEELNQMIEQIEERQVALDDREKLFNERVTIYENRRDNLKQNAAYLVGMPPENAVNILLEMDDQDVIDILRMTEEQAVAASEASLVSYWLSLMPSARAAALQRKMARKTGG